MPLMVRGSAFYFGDAVNADPAGMPKFYQWIRDTGPNVQWPFISREQEGEIRRNLFCDVTDTHFYGIFLSARNAEFQHFVVREADRVTVEARSNNGNPPVEMNFFAIRLDSNKGIFSHYLGSYRFQQFLSDLWVSYRHFVDMKKAEVLENADEHATKDVMRQYSLHGKRNFSPLFTPGTFDELVERLASVSEVRMTSYEVEDHDDRPVSNNISSVHKVYRLNAQPVDRGVISWIKNKKRETLRRLSSGRSRYSGSVIGEDSLGGVLAIGFENTLEDHLEFLYDDIGTFEISDIARHDIIAEMLTKMSESILFRPAV